MQRRLGRKLLKLGSGGLTYEGFRKSKDDLMQFIAVRGNSKPHLAATIDSQ
jgi:hypothetical protein